MGKEIKFRPATFYMGIADMLAREVEGQRDDGEDPSRVSQEGFGVNLEEPPREPAPRANEKKAEKERTNSLDAVGANVHDPNTTSSHTPLESEPRTSNKRDPPS